MNKLNSDRGTTPLIGFLLLFASTMMLSLIIWTFITGFFNLPVNNTVDIALFFGIWALLFVLILGGAFLMEYKEENEKENN